MSESDTMFNKRDRRCAAVQPILSTDPTYDNRGPLPAPSKWKSGLPRITGTCPGWWKQSFRLRLWSLVWFQVRATSCHFEVGLKVNTKVYLECAEECGNPLVQSGVRWQQDSAPAHKSKESQVWLQKECYDFVPLSHSSPWPEPAGLLRLVICREDHQHDLPQHQNQPLSTEYSPSSRRCLWKRHIPSSGSVSRRWLRLKAATLNRCQLYYIIKLPELIFSIYFF